MRVLAVLITALLLPSATPSWAARPSTSRPTHASLRKAYEQNLRSFVTVKHGKRSGPGVIVGAGGQVLTSVQQVGLEQATVVVDGEERPAKVLAADAKLKVAVLQLESTDASRWPAPAAHRTELAKGTWIVGVLPASAKSKKEPTPLAGQIRQGPTAKSPFVLTDLALPPGSPLFDTRGRLVAVVVERAGRIGSRALPIGAVPVP